MAPKELLISFYIGSHDILKETRAGSLVWVLSWEATPSGWYPLRPWFNIGINIANGLRCKGYVAR